MLNSAGGRDPSGSQANQRTGGTVWFNRRKWKVLVNGAANGEAHPMKFAFEGTQSGSLSSGNVSRRISTRAKVTECRKLGSLGKAKARGQEKKPEPAMPVCVSSCIPWTMRVTRGTLEAL